MKTSVKVKQGQTLMDIALQEYGAFEATPYLAVANNISITSDLVGGQVITLVDMTFNKVIGDYCKNHDVSPQSDIKTTDGYDRLFWKEFSNTYA